MTKPHLYSFRRCPYAIRARIALNYAGIDYRIIEVDLKNKPPQLLRYSPKGTVPVLVTETGRVIDESLDIMDYVLGIRDPDNWQLTHESDRNELTHWLSDWHQQWVESIRYVKYASRYPDIDHRLHEETLQQLLDSVNESIEKNNGYLLRQTPCLIDAALFPLIRQYAIINLAEFNQKQGRALVQWLENWLYNPHFTQAMQKTKPN